jgi:hypothetical protein
MAIRWGAPVLAAGMVALVASVPAIGGYFGATNYSGNTPPNCCAQTHFVMAGDDAKRQPDVYVTQAGSKADEKILVIEEPESGNRPAALTANPEISAAISPPRPDKSRESGPEAHPGDGEAVGAAKRPDKSQESAPQAHLVYETVLKPVTETTYTPVTETVMKECRTMVNEKVHDTQYKEYTVNVRKKVCEPVVHNQCYMISKPVCETVYQDTSRKVCKTVTETLFKECPKSVCKTVTETVVRERTRIVLKDVQETVCREVCKSVPETITCNRLVTKVVPETVCENVCVRGHLAWKEVPKYECSFDPCTCSIAQKQVGTVRRLVREPAQTVTRQVTRDKTIVEQVPETKVVQRMVVEKVPTTITKKVPTKVCEKVPINVTRKVITTEMVKVPYTVHRKVLTTELVKVPVIIHRRALGAYVDAKCLSPEAARRAKGVEFIAGGPGALGNPNAVIYEACGHGRVFVEGLRGMRTVTHYVTKTIEVTEVRKVPCRTTRIVQREVVKMVPTTVTRMVPSTVTRMVLCQTCRLVTGKMTNSCQEVATNCQPAVVLQEPCRYGSKMARIFSEMGPRKLHRLFMPSCGQSCDSQCHSPSACVSDCGPRIRLGLTACNTSETSCGCTTCKTWFGLFHRPCRPHPFRDFMSRLWSHRSTCDSCQCAPCSSSTPVTGTTQPPVPQKKPPTTLPPLTSLN